MADINELVAELNQLHEELQSGKAVPSPELVARVKELAEKAKSTTAQAHENLKAEATAMAADLKAKAAELSKPKAKPAPPPFPHPWEDHQGLETEKLQHMVESLVQLARTPPSGKQH